jgi:uroporphyrinogen decarboxylase
MRSTGISCFSYPKLVEALGLPRRLPRVHDTGQMLALPDLDVLDALGCDVVTIDGGVTNAFEEAEKWHEYDFGGRLPARVLSPAAFETRPDGTVVQWGSSFMPPSSYVFNSDHSGQPLLDLDQPLPLLDLKEVAKNAKAAVITDEQVKRTADLARRVRASTDRAVFFTDHCGAGIGVGGWCGIGIFPVICKLEPEYVKELHEIQIGHAIANVRALLPEVKDSVDIIMTTADDWGTQASLIASPGTYKELFQPYYRRLNDEIHRLLPDVKIFMHNCGAIYPILDAIVDSGFDIINPVQWPAGGHSYREWKDKVRKRASFWGGGVNTQHTVTMGSLEDVEREVAEVVAYMKQDGGYVFNNIHNLLAEIPADKILSMYRVAAEA